MCSAFSVRFMGLCQVLKLDTIMSEGGYSRNSEGRVLFVVQSDAQTAIS